MMKALTRLGAAAALLLAPSALAQTAVTPSALWSRVQKIMHQHTLLPGSRRYQPGSRTADYYTIDGVNSAALNAVRKAGSVEKTVRYPTGSILIKENFAKNKKLINVTVMIKLDKFDKSDRNWLMANYSPNGVPLAFGKVKPCIQCHEVV